MAIMLRVLWLIRPWQPRYFFGSAPLISPRPRAGLAPSRPCVTQAAQRGYSRRQRSRAAPPRPPGGPAAPGGSGRARSQKKGKKSHLGCFFFYRFQSARREARCMCSLIFACRAHVFCWHPLRLGQARQRWPECEIIQIQSLSAAKKCNSRQLFYINSTSGVPWAFPSPWQGTSCRGGSRAIGERNSSFVWWWKPTHGKQAPPEAGIAPLTAWFFLQSGLAPFFGQLDTLQSHLYEWTLRLNTNTSLLFIWGFTNTAKYFVWV